MAVRRNALVELFWRLHPRIYSATGGRIGGHMLSMPVLLLTTRGRKSGLERTTALTYLPRDDDFVVIASCLGEPRHPQWWLNLLAEPKARVQVRRQRMQVTAREAQDAEREELWRAVVERTSDYDEYAARTTRKLPVVVLQPA